MTSERPETRVPFDEARLQLVRAFLRREFRGCRHRDYFEFDKTAQVFLIETDRNVRHTLVIPKSTFEDADFIVLLNRQLVTALELAGSLRVTLTPRAPKALAGESNTMGGGPFERFLTWRRTTDRVRATVVRRPLAYGATMLVLGFGACVLISSLAWEVRDPRQRVSEWRLVPAERDATPSDQPQSAVPPSPVSATGIERARLDERPAVAARGPASTGRPAPRPRDRRDRNLSSNVAASIRTPVDRLRRLIGYIPEVQLGKAMVRWVKAQPSPAPEARRLERETPQSL